MARNWLPVTVGKGKFGRREDSTLGDRSHLFSDTEILSAIARAFMQISWRILPRRPGRRGRRPTLPSATVCLLVACLAGLGAWSVAHLPGDGSESVLQGWTGLTVGDLLEGRWWELCTHLFLPGSVSWLLLVELPMLFLAGRHLESVVGRRHVVALFLMAGAAGGLAQAAVGSLHGAADLPVAGPGAGVLAVFVALACAMPELDVVPPLSLATGNAGWLRLKHGALAVVLGAAFAMVRTEATVALLHEPESWAGPLAARLLTAGVVACIYMRQLGFGRRAQRSPEEAAAWAMSALQEDEEEEFEDPVFAAPVAAAAGRLVVPRFTEVERRMSPREYISARIDPILDKILRHGLGSLTEEERRTLENARRKIGRGR